MTLHFDLLMITGLCMIPGGLILAFLGVWIAACFDAEPGSFAGGIPGILTAVAGIAVFLAGLGMELH